jgi:hypothetical protein
MVKRVVGFDAAGVRCALVRTGIGKARLIGYAEEAVAEGVIVPQPFESNLSDPQAVRETLRVCQRRLDSNGRSAVLVLPDGIAHFSLLSTDRDQFDPEWARFRLAPTLPYPADEMVISALRVGRRRFLAAAVRRQVVSGYEETVREAGLAVERVDLLPFAVLGASIPRARALAGMVDLFLSETAYTLVAWRRGTVGAFRSRRRDRSPGEVERVAAEVQRTAHLSGLNVSPRVRVAGCAARSWIGSLVGAGFWAGPVLSLPSATAEIDANEAAFVSAAL